MRRGRRRTPKSSRALKTMVVDDMHSIAPRNMEFISSHPSSRPAVNPSDIMPITMVAVAIMAVLPTCSSFLKLNSSPRANSRNSTPICPHVSTLLMFEIHDSPQT